MSRSLSAEDLEDRRNIFKSLASSVTLPVTLILPPALPQPADCSCLTSLQNQLSLSLGLNDSLTSRMLILAVALSLSLSHLVASHGRSKLNSFFENMRVRHM